MEIKQLSDIKYSENPLITFDASVISVNSDGDGEKKPLKATLKLEESGELTQVCSWEFGILQDLKDAVNSYDVFRFEGIGNVYNNTNQIRIGKARKLGMQSTKKVLNVVDTKETMKKLQTIVDMYIPEAHIYRKIIDELVFKDPKFSIWPAASKIHHNYPGGLAKHTLGVVELAIQIWKLYNGENLNVQAIVAGAILHDIGKIEEYDKNCERTIYGNYVPHPIIGYQKFFKTALKLGLDPETNLDLVNLGHIILTHHGKLEFGAPTLPYTAEALVVSQADATDATVEITKTTLNNIELNHESEKIFALDNIKVFKWHN